MRFNHNSKDDPRNFSKTGENPEIYPPFSAPLLSSEEIIGGLHSEKNIIPDDTELYSQVSPRNISLISPHIDESFHLRSRNREFALTDSLNKARALGQMMAKYGEDAAIVLLTPEDPGYEDLPYRAIPYGQAVIDGRDIVEKIMHNN